MIHEAYISKANITIEVVFVQYILYNKEVYVVLDAINYHSRNTLD